MTRTTKVVAWVGAIFGIVSVAAVALIMGLMMHADYRNTEHQREQERAVNTLKQGLTQDLQTLSQTQIKPMTGDDIRKWVSGANSPTPTPEK